MADQGDGWITTDSEGYITIATRVSGLARDEKSPGTTETLLPVLVNAVQSRSKSPESRIEGVYTKASLVTQYAH